MKRKIQRTLILMMALIVLTAVLPAQAAGNGLKIRIRFGNTNSVFNRDEIHLKAYKIAEGEYGQWTMLKPYKEIKVFTDDPKDDGSKWIDASMNSIRAVIQRSGIGPTQKAQSNKDGIVTFTNLENGIYYIQKEKAPEGLNIRPMLLAVPGRNGGTTVSVTGKYTYNPTTPPPKNLPPPKKGQRYVNIDEYETALGLGNIQIHVGVCYE